MEKESEKRCINNLSIILPNKWIQFNWIDSTNGEHSFTVFDYCNLTFGFGNEHHALNCFIARSILQIACRWLGGSRRTFLNVCLSHLWKCNVIIRDFIVVNYNSINRLWETDAFIYGFWMRYHFKVVFFHLLPPNKLMKLCVKKMFKSKSKFQKVLLNRFIGRLLKQICYVV